MFIFFFFLRLLLFMFSPRSHGSFVRFNLNASVNKQYCNFMWFSAVILDTHHLCAFIHIIQTHTATCRYTVLQEKSLFQMRSISLLRRFFALLPDRSISMHSVCSSMCDSIFFVFFSLSTFSICGEEKMLIHPTK